MILDSLESKFGQTLEKKIDKVAETIDSLFYDNAFINKKAYYGYMFQDGFEIGQEKTVVDFSGSKKLDFVFDLRFKYDENFSLMVYSFDSKRFHLNDDVISFLMIGLEELNWNKLSRYEFLYGDYSSLFDNYFKTELLDLAASMKLIKLVGGSQAIEFSKLSNGMEMDADKFMRVLTNIATKKIENHDNEFQPLEYLVIFFNRVIKVKSERLENKELIETKIAELNSKCEGYFEKMYDSSYYKKFADSASVEGHPSLVEKICSKDKSWGSCAFDEFVKILEYLNYQGILTKLEEFDKLCKGVAVEINKKAIEINHKQLAVADLIGRIEYIKKSDNFSSRLEKCPLSEDLKADLGKANAKYLYAEHLETLFKRFPVNERGEERLSLEKWIAENWLDIKFRELDLALEIIKKKSYPYVFNKKIKHYQEIKGEIVDYLNSIDFYEQHDVKLLYIKLMDKMLLLQGRLDLQRAEFHRALNDIMVTLLDTFDYFDKGFPIEVSLRSLIKIALYHISSYNSPLLEILTEAHNNLKKIEFSGHDQFLYKMFVGTLHKASLDGDVSAFNLIESLKVDDDYDAYDIALYKQIYSSFAYDLLGSKNLDYSYVIPTAKSAYDSASIFYQLEYINIHDVRQSLITSLMLSNFSGPAILMKETTELLLAVEGQFKWLLQKIESSANDDMILERVYEIASSWKDTPDPIIFSKDDIAEIANGKNLSRASEMLDAYLYYEKGKFQKLDMIYIAKIIDLYPEMPCNFKGGFNYRLALQFGGDNATENDLAMMYYFADGLDVLNKCKGPNYIDYSSKRYEQIAEDLKCNVYERLNQLENQSLFGGPSKDVFEKSISFLANNCLHKDVESYVVEVA